jgi:hypothetical protein
MNAQEGGFQPPVDSQPPDAHMVPGFYAPQEFVLGRPQAPPALSRPPKPGETLGEYLLEEKLPPRYAIPPRSRAAPSVTLLSPVASRPPIPILPVFGNTRTEALRPRAAKPEAADRTSIRFIDPPGMKVAWQLPEGSFSEVNTVTGPIEHDFVQGRAYRLRLTGVSKEKPDETFYPTIEIAPAAPKTRVFLAHAAVPVAFGADEFAQARDGRLVVKVIYLPDPVAQDYSTVVSAEEVVSTRLEPGVDPVAEARRRGTILAVIRLGNIDLEKR